MSDRNLTEQLLRLKPGVTLTAQCTDDGETIVFTLEHHGEHERLMTARAVGVMLLRTARFDLAAMEFDHLLADLQRAYEDGPITTRQKDTK